MTNNSCNLHPTPIRTQGTKSEGEPLPAPSHPNPTPMAQQTSWGRYGDIAAMFWILVQHQAYVPVQIRSNPSPSLDSVIAAALATAKPTTSPSTSSSAHALASLLAFATNPQSLKGTFVWHPTGDLAVKWVNIEAKGRNMNIFFVSRP
ncbi:hypothetical protein CFIMG_004356RA [Ceratocystis fimbriata CBS 114723]|uniref:Uncharacterized protein n=1 Tax=Ceratocystis fimbriata CBS 114723 TaxID=1035309 RepID=A0A2C5WZ47_9PEZI|nr:hypothetical protein CFIMG_004356RA [Ceratocystis fimbriata CBS 114723]